MNNLEIIYPKLESMELTDEPLPIPIALIKPENEKRNELTLTDMPFEIITAVLMNLHPLEQYSCYGVSKGIRRIVEKKLALPKTLGIYLSGKKCVVFADGKSCEYFKEARGCGYGYGTYEAMYDFIEHIECECNREKRRGFLEGVTYVHAGLNVFLAILMTPDIHLELLWIYCRNGYNPNNFIATIKKTLISLKDQLQVTKVRLDNLNSNQAMQIIPNLKPKTLKIIYMDKGIIEEDGNENMKELTSTKQWKAAVEIKIFFYTMIPIRNHLHLEKILIMRHTMTARELANIKKSMFKHKHIRQIEVVIKDANFDNGIARRVLGPCTPDPTEPEAGFYHGSDTVLDIYMHKDDDDDGSTGILMTRLPK